MPEMNDMTEVNDVATSSTTVDPNDPFHGDYTYRREIPSADDAERRVVRWAQTGFPSSLKPLTSAAALPALRAGLCDLPWELLMIPDTSIAAVASGPVHIADESLSIACWAMDTLRDAELLWIDTDASSATFDAIPDIDSATTLHDLPALNTGFRSAFCVFATPFHGTDFVTGNPLLVDAVLWGPGTLTDDTVDGSVNGMSMLSFRMVHPDRTEHTGPELDSFLADPRFHGWLPLGQPSHWRGDLSIEQPSLRSIGPDQNASHVEDRRLLAGLLAILNEPNVFIQNPAVIPRGERRRLARAHTALSADAHAARIVSLGMPPTPTASPSTPNDTSTGGRRGHLVRSHTRLQAYGPGRTLRRLRVIPSHWRGDMDNPMSGDRVYRIAGDIIRGDTPTDS